MKRLALIAALAFLAAPLLTLSQADAQTSNSKAKAEQLLRKGAPGKPVVQQPKANPMATTGATPGRLNPYTNQVSPAANTKTGSALKAGRCLNGVMSC